MGRGPEWTNKQVRELGRLWADKASDELIASTLGRTVKAVKSKRLEQRFCADGPTHKPTAIHRKCVEMRGSHTASQISEKLGISRNAVISYWHRDDLANRQREQRRAA